MKSLPTIISRLENNRSIANREQGRIYLMVPGQGPYTFGIRNLEDKETL